MVVCVMAMEKTAWFTPSCIVDPIPSMGHNTNSPATLPVTETELSVPAQQSLHRLVVVQRLCAMILSAQQLWDLYLIIPCSLP